MQEIFHVKATGGSSPYLGDAANTLNLSDEFEPGVIPAPAEDTLLQIPGGYRYKSERPEAMLRAVLVDAFAFLQAAVVAKAAFACSASLVKPAASCTAMSARILRSRPIPAFLSPLMNCE